MKRRRIVLVVLLLAAAATAAWLWLLRPPAAAEGLLASGTVEATEARLGFQATGRLEAVLAREGDRVTAGAELAYLDRTEIEARRDQAAAQVEAARAGLLELERGFRSEEIAEARAAVNAARDRLEDAERDLQRSRELHEGGAISREALDKAAVARSVGRSGLEQAEERLRLLERGPRPERVEAQRAHLAQARATLQATEAVLANLSITAPFDGLVTVRHREPGEIVAPGSPVLTVLDPADRWVRIYVPEDRVGAVGIGDRAEILSDTFPEKRYPGEVIYISPQAEFTPKAVQTQEERVRLVYAVKVRVLEDPDYELKPGLPVDVVLKTAPVREPLQADGPPSTTAGD